MNISIHLPEPPSANFLSLFITIGHSVSFGNFNANVDVYLVNNLNDAAKAKEISPAARVLLVTGERESWFQIPSWLTLVKGEKGVRNELFYC